jgi:hypothetical protein
MSDRPKLALATNNPFTIAAHDAIYRYHHRKRVIKEALESGRAGVAIVYASADPEAPADEWRPVPSDQVPAGVRASLQRLVTEGLIVACVRDVEGELDEAPTWYRAAKL